MQNIPVFDGHNDALGRMYMSKSANPAQGFLNGQDEGHLDLIKARAGSMVGGFFALYSPSSDDPLGFLSKLQSDDDGVVSIPNPPPLGIEDAQRSIISQMSILAKIERESLGDVVICKTSTALQEAIRNESLAILLHLEGADAIDENFDFLEILYRFGLRSIGPVWSRDNIFGYGVPFRFPSSPDLGEGLTSRGEDLVRLCNEMKILVDTAHTTEKGFWDIAKISNAPLIATHSNAHALCPSPRNLTDRQLHAIRDTDGMVGLNFATGFLRSDGAMRPDTDLQLMVEQIDYLIGVVGENHVGFGSDYDGAIVPESVATAAKLPVLVDALRHRGYSEELLQKIASKNWLSVLEKTIE
ncbi:hypothetical protein DSM107133_04498 (plasmid) [Pseudosulfitobacter sp. DSM 107133]|nr:hypothetical protein DSM107133_04498 [Pseudosulfitobacter sp. DSM 107133]